MTYQARHAAQMAVAMRNDDTLDSSSHRTAHDAENAQDLRSSRKDSGAIMPPKSPASAYQRAARNAQGGGYQSMPSAGSPTQTEAWALIEAARRMAVALESGPLDDNAIRRQLRDALRLNWRLWTIFQAQLTTDGSGVPMEIRENMLTLCGFVDKHTIATMAEPTPEKVVVLININREIASGLFESLKNLVPEEGAAQEEQAQEPVDPNKSFSIGV